MALFFTGFWGAVVNQTGIGKHVSEWFLEKVAVAAPPDSPPTTVAQLGCDTLATICAVLLAALIRPIFLIFHGRFWRAFGRVLVYVLDTEDNLFVKLRPIKDKLLAKLQSIEFKVDTSYIRGLGGIVGEPRTTREGGRPATPRGG